MSFLRKTILILLFLQTYSASINADIDNELEALMNQLDIERLTDTATHDQDDQPPLDETDTFPKDETDDHLDRLVYKTDHTEENKQMSDAEGLIETDDEKIADTIPDKTDVQIYYDNEDQFKRKDEYPDDQVKFEPVGCYKDGGARPLPVLVKNFRGNINWKNLNETINACAQAANAKGYKYFAVQFYGECWSGPDAEESFAKEGKSENCVAGVGKHWTNFVYKIAEVKYEPIGCFKDGGSRPLPILLKNLRSSINWKNLNLTINACAQVANSKGYKYFGVQFYGECWSGPDAEESFFKEGQSENCVTGVGKQGTNFVYKIVKVFDLACENYLALDEASRSVNFYEPHVDVQCDKNLYPNWYRFVGDAGTQMATSCVPITHCATHAPGWMVGALPSMADGRVHRKVCFHWNHNCCYKSVVTTVRNCGDYYVYMLSGSPFCQSRYCGSKGDSLNELEIRSSFRVPVESRELIKKEQMTDDEYFISENEVRSNLNPYEPVGCYYDKAGANRPLPELLKNFRGSLDWTNLNKTIRACAVLAQDKGYSYFGIQFYGECWSGVTAEQTYDKDGPSTKCIAGVGPAGSINVYRFHKVPPPTVEPTTAAVSPECVSHLILDSADRSQYSGPVHFLNYKCDKDLVNDWYRFKGDAGTQMADTCVTKQHCGTHAPGWMKGSLPSLADGIVERKVCFHWKDDCCYWDVKIIVRNCAGFYVYKLDKPPHCSLRYCGNGQSPATTMPPTTTVAATQPPPLPTTSSTPEECIKYIELSSADRSVSQGPPADQQYKCDDHISDNWYRFTGNAGSRIATSCVPIFHCGTHSPGWMNGSFPSVAEGIVDREACFNWNGDCCHWRSAIMVRNCGGFYVYRLDKPPNCRLRYCSNGRQETPNPTTSKPVTTPLPATTEETTNIPTTVEQTTSVSMTPEETTILPTTSSCTKAPTTVRPGPAPKMRRSIICQNRRGSLRCPRRKRIKILYANYGRTQRRVCPHISINTTRCFSIRSTAIIRRACNGRSSCRLYAKNRIYGDPCWGTYKYIDVKYQCV